MTIHIQTPLIESLSVGKELSAKVWLKMEALQPCGSFKARGVGYACSKYASQGACAFISSSGGNAGLAVAYSGRCLSIPVTVVVPVTTKQKAIDLMEQEGATVVVQGELWIEAHQHAMSLAKQGAVYIHPFDDPYLWEGHASLIDEVKAAGVKPDLIVLSVGGGGLLSGVVMGLQRNDWQEIPILAVETQGADSLAVAVAAKEHIALSAISSIATSLGATKVAGQAFALLQQHPIISQVVSDKQAVDACLNFLDEHRVLVEPACGASLAAIYQHSEILHNKQNILVIICGGVGATVEQLNQWSHSL
ncbi:MAG: pyridoxal-phosphate dependent enzyme [Pseudomonadales bacterium]|nr:pyridoxal-phosphate dependent enzyme [Pseudomonadales bacterium]NRA15278.1 pyridoxal-phosphate dependent enzyme [Oceanospirillaceae bacterium]